MTRKHRRVVVWTLIAAMTYAPSIVYAQMPSAKLAARPAKPKIDLGYVTPETAAVVVAYPRHVLTAPGMEMLPTEVMTAAGLIELGIDPLAIEQIMVVAEPPVGGPPGVAVVARMAEPVPQGKILGPLWDQTTEGELGGQSYRRAANPMGFSIFQPDDRTLIVGMDPFIAKLLANHASPTEGRMSKVLGRMVVPPDAMAILLVEPIRPLISMPLAMAPLPAELADLKKLPELTNSLGAKVNLTGPGLMQVSLKANDEAAARQIEQILNKSLTAAGQMARANMAQQEASEDPIEQAMAQYAMRMNDRMIQALRPVRRGSTLTLEPPVKENLQMTSVAVIGVLVALLLPAVQAAREAARRAQSNNSLKQLLLAMLNHEQARGRFPARANFDQEGKPLLSWRVHILPFIEQEALYKQFHLDEPWDSEHNRALIPMMPQVYQNPSAPSQPGMAHYLAVCGEGLAFDGTEGRTIADFRDGTANTILVVEVDPDRAVVWTKPDDWQSDAENPMAGLGAAHPGGFNAGFCDGSVRMLPKTLDAGVFRALLTIAGGENVDDSQIR